MSFSIARRLIALTGGFILLLAVPAMAHPTVDIVAANWKFTPTTIVLHVGETTVLHITSAGGVHGIASDDLEIKQTAIMPGKFIDISVTPKKAGIYKIHCSIPCGNGHGDMVLTVEVQA